jgi:nucleotide-binding universal stress UspA family protein
MGCGVESVILLRVFDVYIPSYVETYVSKEQRIEADQRAEAEAEKYLDEIAGRMDLKGAEVQKQIISGKTAESIAEYATKKDMDLIAIATHGRSGITRWAWGSVADRILRSSCIPVLMVRAPGCVPGI